MVPLVSVVMVTYNHEKYIAKAIESILMQVTNFDYEIIIGEDCSTDKTKMIIREFENKYPEIIFPIYQEANVGPMRNVYEFSVPKAIGKYIAPLEGDDYWTDPNKLQRQVDFLEANPDFAICFHNMEIIYENSPEKNYLSNIEQKEISDIYDLARYNYIYTASCMFRNHGFPDWLLDCPVGDYPLHLFNAQFGKIKFFNETMAVYRIHDDGIWENKSMTYKQINWISLLSVMVVKFKKTK